jgi:hypothetical protein
MRALLRPPAWLVYFYLVASLVFGIWGGRHLYVEQQVMERKQWEALLDKHRGNGYKEYLENCKFCFYQREAEAKIAYFSKIDALLYQQAKRYANKEAYRAYLALCHLCQEKSFLDQ